MGNGVQSLCTATALFALLLGSDDVPPSKYSSGTTIALPMNSTIVALQWPLCREKDSFRGQDNGRDGSIAQVPHVENGAAGASIQTATLTGERTERGGGEGARLRSSFWKWRMTGEVGKTRCVMLCCASGNLGVAGVGRACGKLTYVTFMKNTLIYILRTSPHSCPVICSISCSAFFDAGTTARLPDLES